MYPVAQYQFFTGSDGNLILFILKEESDHDISGGDSDEEYEPGDDSDDMSTSSGATEDSVEDELNSSNTETIKVFFEYFLNMQPLVAFVLLIQILNNKVIPVVTFSPKYIYF